MERLIQLRSGMDSLTDIEFERFVKSIDRKSISSIIFDRFNYEMQCIKSMNDINGIIPDIQNLNHNITEIITSRDKDDNDTESVDKIDKLPLVIISAIASFLDYISTTHFELSNRAIFIGSRSPISLYQAPKKEFNQIIKFCTENNNKYDWRIHRFRFCKKLILSLESFFKYDNDGEYFYSVGNQYSLQNLPHFNSIETLKINDGFQYKWEGGNNPYDHYWSIFNQDLKVCDVSNVKLLSVSGSCSRYHPYCVETLSIFPALQYAKCYTCTWNMDLSTLEWPQHLQGIVLDHVNPTFETGGDWKFGEKFESFHGSQGVPGKIVEKLKNLKELCLVHKKSQYISDPMDHLELLVNNGLSSLERVYYMDTVEEIDNDRQEIMQRLWKLEGLNYIGINCGVKKVKLFLGELCNALDVRLKERMKIKMTCNRGIKENICEDLLKLIDKMNHQSSNFMFIGEFIFAKELDIEKVLDSLKEKYIVTHSMKNGVKAVIHTFVVSNKSCNICGYNESWLMNCNYCNADYGGHAMYY